MPEGTTDDTAQKKKFFHAKSGRMWSLIVAVAGGVTLTSIYNALEIAQDVIILPQTTEQTQMERWKRKRDSMIVAKFMHQVDSILHTEHKRRDDGF